MPDAGIARQEGAKLMPGVSQERAAPPLWLLALATTLGTLSNHLIVPALPAVAHDLRVSPGAIQMAISVYLLGLAGGQLLYGPVSDAFGRRGVLLAGLALFTVGSVGAACSPDLRTLLAARVVQALGGCAGIALGRAIVRDTTHGEETARQLAALGMMVLIWPGVAPMIGGALVAAFGWQPLFVLLAALGVATFCLVWRRLPETRRGTGVLTARGVLADYRELLGCRPFVAFAVGGGAAATSVYAFLAAAPFILSDRLRQPPEVVGIYSGVVMLGIVAGTTLTTWGVRRLGTTRMLVAGCTSLLASSGTLLVLVLTEALNVAGLMGTMLVFACGIGLVHPILMANAIALRPHLAGSASGFYGFNQMAIGTVSATLASLGHDAAMSCALVLFGVCLFSSACVGWAMRHEAEAGGEPA